MADFNNDMGSADGSRIAWESPKVLEVVPIDESEGNGLGGPDFASEQS